MGIKHAADDIVRAHEGFGYMMFEAERLIEEKRRNPGDGMLLDTMIKIVDEGGLSERELKESIQILWGLGRTQSRARDGLGAGGLCRVPAHSPDLPRSPR